MRRRTILLLALLPLAAFAQTATSPGLAGHDSNAPVDVAADHGTLASKDNKAVVYGNVHIVQDTMTLDADRVTISFSDVNGKQTPHRMDASGGVTLKTPTETARSQFAIYDLDRKVVTMLGGVVLNRNGNEVRSARLVYDMNTGRANVDSGGAGGGRVTGHFSVPQSDVKPKAATPPAATAPAAKAAPPASPPK